MKFLFCVFIFLLCASSVHTQPVVPLTAMQLIAQVKSEAVQSFAPDAELVQILFTEFLYMGSTLTLNPAAGSANGWLYRFHSESLGTERLYFAYKNFKTVVIEAPPGTAQIPAYPVSMYVPLPDSVLDSPQALLAVKAGGANAFLQAHTTAKIVRATAFVNPDAGSVFPVGTLWAFWFAAGLDTLRCTIDAVSGTSVDCALLTSTDMPLSDAEFQVLPLYPNPVNGELHLTLRGMHGPTTMLLYNMVGEIVFWKLVDIGETSITLNTSAIDRGTYLLVLRSATGTQTQRIIVMHR